MKIVPEKRALSFTLIMVSSLTEIHFNKAQYIDYFLFTGSIFCVLFKKSVLKHVSGMFSYVFLLRLAFLCRSAVHLELIFVCGVGRGQDTFFPHIAIRVS